MTEDVRFNKPAKDGEQYTDEGIYTITVSNLYTNQTTTKVIYVGTDDVLKAHVATGLPISDVEYQLSLGATVAADGSLIPAPEQSLPPISDTSPSKELELETKSIDNSGDKSDNMNSPTNDAPKDSEPTQIWPFAAGGTLLAAFIATGILLTKNNRKKHQSNCQGIDSKESDDNGGK